MKTWRPWPRSLAGQLVWIIFGGVTLSLLASAAIHLHDRETALSNAGGLQTAQRFAAIVRVLDPLSNPEREKITAILETPLQFVRLLTREPPEADPTVTDERVTFVKGLLERFLGDGRPLRVVVMNVQGDADLVVDRRVMGPDMTTGMPMPRHHWRHMEMMGRTSSHGISFVAQVRLVDGTWAEFHNHLPGEVFTWPWHLIWSLVILFVVVFALSTLAVRLVTRPMARLAGAARALGQDFKHPPLVESGTVEVREAVQAFNAMQARLVQYVQERTHILAAVSHDLHTPLTRMRLRVEMMKDEGMRDTLLPNLDEMESMAEAALDYIQGMEGLEVVRKTDIPSLLEDLQETFQEMGHEVSVQCGEMGPFPLMRKSFKRCLSNLIGNAVKYGERAQVRATLHGDRLRISIADDGPGIPEGEMGKMLEPFVRLEDSRNKKTGGAGLGLSIARNIVRAHRGELTLRNRPEGGLEVILTIPKGAFLKDNGG